MVLLLRSSADILLIKGSNVTERLFPGLAGVDVSPCLYIGTTMEVLQLSGTVPRDIDMLHRCVKSDAAAAADFLILLKS